MTFAGISNDQERANVIAYLRSLSPNPVALPPPVAAPPPAPPPAASAAPAPPAQPSVEARLSSADPKAGEADTWKLGCVACHIFNDGGKAGVGPNLYGVVGEPGAGDSRQIDRRLYFGRPAVIVADAQHAGSGRTAP
jgi:cytochrome c